MKKTLLAVVLLLIILIIGIFEQIYIKKTLADLSEMLINLESTIDDQELSEEKMKELMAYWKDNRDPIEGFVYNNETREIVTKLSEINGFIEAKQLDNAKPVITTTLDIIDHTQHVLEFSWHHIL
jgi:hypothetical protein